MALLLLSVNDGGFGVVWLIHLLGKPNQTGLNWQTQMLWWRRGTPVRKPELFELTTELWFKEDLTARRVTSRHQASYLLLPAVKWMLTLWPGKCVSLFEMHSHLCVLSCPPSNKAGATNVTGPSSPKEMKIRGDKGILKFSQQVRGRGRSGNSIISHQSPWPEWHSSKGQCIQRNITKAPLPGRLQSCSPRWVASTGRGQIVLLAWALFCWIFLFAFCAWIKSHVFL